MSSVSPPPPDPPPADTSLAWQKERTLRIAWLLSAWGPLAGGFALYLGPSAVVLADVLRRSSELLALFLSWRVFLRIARNPDAGPRDYQRQQHQASLIVAGAMFLSLTVIAWNTMDRLVDGDPVGWILPGLLIALAGSGVNCWLWRRNRRLALQEPGPLIRSQWRFYRAKTLIDLCVVATLLSAGALRETQWAAWIDTLGTTIIAIFLFFTARRIARTAWGGLRRMAKE